MKIYIAAPLFSLAEKKFNKKLKEKLLKIDYNLNIILPQEFISESKLEIYNHCINSINDSDIIVAILDGPDADSGTTMELGYAKAKNKYIIGVRTDIRELECMGTNIMLYYSCDKYIKSNISMQTLANNVYLAITKKDDDIHNL